MSGTRKTLIVVTTSLATVEALKDQGICRWNYSIWSMHQHAKNNIKSFANAKMFSASSCRKKIFDDMGNNEVKKSKEFMMEKVLNLACLGPNTVRF
ncbi:hypothetical protein Dsin_022658 [Dipteronia sinensis]|uniref:Uncharacterized protein n=1 Tax=Dipteronia sinensis TaxID=43782 RepID=A0AAE0A1T2_9ROSI|nr:hypothetical protein Dsin_022658 [Dipteronia sinensis]